MEILLIFWLLCGVVCYFIMKSKGYPNDNCLAHGVGGALLGVIWLIVVLCKKDYSGTSSTSQLSDMELLSKLMDLKERGAITEAEFEEKKRELLSNVKKNDNTVIQTRTLRMITVLLLSVVCVIFGMCWLLYDIGFSGLTVEYGSFLSWISSSYGATAIICVIIVIMLIMKVDMRFLCVPIMVEGFRWFFRSYNILKNISDLENLLPTIYIYPLCAISTVLFIILILFPNKDKHKNPFVILYIIPGICRVIYAIFSFFHYFNIFVEIIPSYYMYLDWSIKLYYIMLYFGESIRVILYIAFISLGVLIQRLSTEKTINYIAIP